jgi:hypothetical protein
MGGLHTPCTAANVVTCHNSITPRTVENCRAADARETAYAGRGRHSNVALEWLRALGSAITAGKRGWYPCLACTRCPTPHPLNQQPPPSPAAAQARQCLAAHVWHVGLPLPAPPHPSQASSRTGSQLGLFKPTPSTSKQCPHPTQIFRSCFKNPDVASTQKDVCREGVIPSVNRPHRHLCLGFSPPFMSSPSYPWRRLPCG